VYIQLEVAIPSVQLSTTFRYSVKMARHIVEIFRRRVAQSL